MRQNALSLLPSMVTSLLTKIECTLLGVQCRHSAVQYSNSSQFQHGLIQFDWLDRVGNQNISVHAQD